MRYSLDRDTNESKCREDGLRDIVNTSQLEAFLGSDNYNAKVEEMLLDILNDIWNVEDATQEVTDHES